METWKSVVGYEGFYEISNLGRLRRNGKCLADCIDSNGYVINILSLKGKHKTIRRHVLVAEAFIPNNEHKREVNHIDGNKLNNTVENLEWVTHRENAIHSWVHGMTRPAPPQEPKAVMQYKDGILISTYQSIKEAAHQNQICDGDISRCCQGKRKTAGGFLWKYANQ